MDVTENPAVVSVPPGWPLLTHPGARRVRWWRVGALGLGIYGPAAVVLLVLAAPDRSWWQWAPAAVGAATLLATAVAVWRLAPRPRLLPTSGAGPGGARALTPPRPGPAETAALRAALLRGDLIPAHAHRDVAALAAYAITRTRTPGAVVLGPGVLGNAALMLDNAATGPVTGLSITVVALILGFAVMQGGGYALELRQARRVLHAATALGATPHLADLPEPAPENDGRRARPAISADPARAGDQPDHGRPG